MVDIKTLNDYVLDKMLIISIFVVRVQHVQHATHILKSIDN